MINNKNKIFTKKTILTIFFSTLFIIVAMSLMSLVLFYHYHFLPGTSINNISLNNLNYQKSLSLSQEKVQIPSALKITLSHQNISIASSSGQLNLSYDLSHTLTQALAQQQTLSLPSLIKQLMFKTNINLLPSMKYDEILINNYINLLAQKINQTGEVGSIEYDQKTNQPIINQGENQITLNFNETKKLLLSSLPHQLSLNAIVDTIEYSYTNDEIFLLENQAKTLINKKINLSNKQIENYKMSLSASLLIPLLNQSPVIKNYHLEQIFALFPPDLERPPQEPALTIDLETKKATSFTPPLSGLKIEKDIFVLSLDQAIQKLINTEVQELDLEIPLQEIPPISSLAEINNFGINEIIGFGESYYTNSIPGRIFNVGHASEKINNTLISPKEEFSFNKTLGNVSAESGYKQGYIIQNGQSVLADGGGVCQVSTTLFRALLDAGLNITLRRPHSYRVGYYELSNDPGFDATVFSGNVDLRFINDTDGYLLITSQADSKNQYMNIKIYGTNDGRYTEIKNYKKYDASPPLPTEYIVDHSLPPGYKKQIDWAVGGLKTSFTHSVYNQDGSLKSEKEYHSNYRPWSAKYLIGP